MDAAGQAKRTPRHLIRLSDWSQTEVDDLLELSMRMKRRASAPRLTGKTVGMLFFRGSLRTRASLEIAVHQLGGETINLTAASDFWQLEEREGTVMDGVAPEHIKDAGLVLSRYVNALAIRPAPAGKTWSIDRQDGEIHAWAKNARVPVINMESALWHPLQALADLMTMREHLADGEGGSKRLKGKRLAVVWTYSPTPGSSSVTNSLLDAAVRQGMQVRVAHPPGYELDAEIVAAAQDSAAAHGARLETGLTPEQAVEGAHVVYARSWQSLEDYGNPTLAASRRSRLTRWCIDERLLALGDGAFLMHAMPVRRNLEVVDSVLDGPRNLMYEQAENRMYSQKALLSLLLGD